MFFETHEPKIPHVEKVKLGYESLFIILEPSKAWMRKYFPIRKKVALFDGFQASPACPSNKSSVEMKVCMQLWWKDDDRKNRSTRRKKLSQYRFVHNKHHTVLARIETVTPTLETDD